MDAMPPTMASIANQQGKYPRFGKRGAPQAFAQKLFEILSNEDQEVVCWTASGSGFVLKDPRRFSEEVLIKYFRRNIFSSFQRQLNLYGFRKITKGPDAGAYCHPFFHRDKPEMLYYVRRSPGTQSAKNNA
ncbi:unnamed protein product, partial [Phaeothamnion confervicola]